MVFGGMVLYCMYVRQRPVVLGLMIGMLAHVAPWRDVGLSLVLEESLLRALFGLGHGLLREIVAR